MWRIARVRDGILYGDDPIAETIAKARIRFQIKQDTSWNRDCIHTKTFGADP
jgi:hypothetical protein